MEKTKNFTVDARTILQLGRDSIRSHVTALVELVKNSYDADATIVEVEIFKNTKEPYIRIADNGFGMTEEIIDDNWLRIGYSEKKKKKRTSKKRRKTGEKGIGRIAADRLGKVLELISKSKRHPTQGLRVNWELFDVEGKNVSDIKILVLESPILKVPDNNKSGTEIKITNLRQSWNKDSLDSLINQLKLLTSPFKKIDDFKIVIKTDIEEIYDNKTIDFNDTILNYSEISIEAITSPSEESITYELYDRSLKKKFLKEIPFKQLLSSSNTEGKKRKKLDKNSIPILEFKILFFLRNRKITKQDVFTNRTDFLGNLDSLTGIKLYRDLIAVRPYGFIDSSAWDWLELGRRKAQNPAGVGRKDYRISPNQVVGAVFIERDNNKKLKDSAGREGIMEEEMGFDILKGILFKAIELIEAHRHVVATKQIGDVNESNAPISKGTQKTLEFFSDEFKLISNNLKSVGQTVYSEILSLEQRGQVKDKLEKAAHNIESSTKEVVGRVEEMLDENRVLKGLATLGITNAVFAHETQGALNTIHLGIDNANRFIKRIPDSFKYKNELFNSITTIQNKTKIIKGWGNFALIRIEIDKRKNPKRHKIHEIVSKAFDEVKDAFEGVNIRLEIKIEKVISKIYPMDLESVLFNLLSNSYKACLQVSERNIIVELQRKNLKEQEGFVLSVEDSGPGIAEEFIHKIWDPLFSTQYGATKNTRGAGLGLTIVQSVVGELEGEVKAIRKGNRLGGARFEVWLPKI